VSHRRNFPFAARTAFLALACALAIAGCKDSSKTEQSADNVPKDETADEFIERVNREYQEMYPEFTASQWLSSTYINDDTKLLAAKGNERFLTQLNRWLEHHLYGRMLTLKVFAARDRR